MHACMHAGPACTAKPASAYDVLFFSVCARVCRPAVYPNRGFLSWLMELDRQTHGRHSLPPYLLCLHEDQHQDEQLLPGQQQQQQDGEGKK